MTFRISGILTSDEQFLVDTKQSQLKLAKLSWLIEEKMGVYFGWTYDEILLPMESRNMMLFETGVPSPEKWDGRLWLTPFKVEQAELPKGLLIILDFDK